MTTDQFTTRADGLINDFRDGASTASNFRDGILDLLLDVARPHLQPEPMPPTTSDEPVKYESLSTRRDHHLTS